MGIIPLWGFQLAIAIPLAFLFRLNKVLVILAANISIPPMIPLILFLSHLTGAFWMGNHAVPLSFHKDLSLELLGEGFYQYVLGAITLAIGSGVVFGLIAYGLLRLSKRYVS